MFRLFVFCSTALLVLMGNTATAGLIDLDPPGQREFVLDRAKLLSQSDHNQVVALCSKLLDEKATPIVVVTIPSMAKFGKSGMRIETFATLLFNDWQIGYEKINGQDWNTGILLLISEGDRKARIELGAGWGRENDALCRQIMDQQIVPNFKKGLFSEGIVAGVNALDQMARGLELPRAVRPWWHYALVVGGIGLAIFTIVSLSRRGASGWAWLFWAAVFSLLGYLLITLLNSSSSGSGSGGSFGGGFSGGGGASGSW